MNYEEPRQIDPKSDREDAGKWRFTTYNRRIGTYAIGYCAEDCPGHDTPEEAREHYRQYLLDKKLRFNDGPESPDTLRRCEAEGCDEHTAGEAFIGPWLHWSLCRRHRNRETAEALCPTALDSIHS